MNLERFPRVGLMGGPTPLQAVPRLAKALGVPTLHLKRDDCTGLAFGGNKTRKLEFTMADAASKRADVVVTTGAWQSNHVRQTAAAAARLGMRCHAVVHSPLSDPSDSYRNSGNLPLVRLLGARLHFAESEEAGEAMAAELLKREASSGSIAYGVPLGASDGIGSLGYVACAGELLRQCAEADIDPSHVVLAVGSAGTYAGLLAGLRALGSKMVVIGISVSEQKTVKHAKVRRVLGQLLETTGGELPEIPDADIVLFDDFVGEGYGVPSAAGDRALELVAQTEGVLLDPVYTAKAMSGLFGLAASGCRMGSPIFLHTGGTPALFAYPECAQRKVQA